MKNCSKCQEVKDLSEFYHNSMGKGKGKRYSSYCKPCHSKFMMDRWKVMKDRAIEYLGGKCKRCQNTYHRSIYQFHHLRDKDAMWDTAKKWSWEKIKSELDKCELLCANCHIYEHSDKD